MSKVRINDLARELEVKSKSILDALTAVGVTEKKTHSSSIEADEAEKVRAYLSGGSRTSGSAASRQPERPKFDLSKVSKPGDALKAILERKQAEAAAKAAPPVVARPAVVQPPAQASTPQKTPATSTPAAPTTTAPAAAPGP
jgi:translation initiation factor IF-2